MKQIITCLDCGSSKIKIVVGEMYKEKLNVLACLEVKGKGIKKGLIVNSEEAIVSIKNSFEKIESVLEIKINKVIAIVPAYFAEYQVVEGFSTITNETKMIHGDDILRVMQGAVYNKVPENKELITIIPIEFWIDEKEKVKDPKRKIGNKLSAKAMLVTAPKKNTFGILSVLETLGIEVVDICFSYIADYYEYIKEEYNEKNVAVINLGADKTEIGIFHKNIPVASDVLPYGSRNIDRDISYMYDINLTDARKLKERFAYAESKDASANEIEAVLTKSGENIKINQYEVSEIVYSRIKEIFELAKKQINFLTKKEISYIIVTGGMAELLGIDEVLKEVLGKKYLLPNIEEMGIRNSRFSSCAGFIKYYYKKLKFREKFASTIEEVEEENLFYKKKNISNGNVLGKIYEYFFDN